ncbi:ABC transporter ATP-binding protein [Anaerobacillus isosaccharinicus]|uniref:ABC transporter ATP-binding protein n=1 Tax=Anaerobacillus isosaccharinicus TaxID=1532552 RepID=A0A1S2KX81_9BACI|nr:ABC transporter ATP-binding protein [Anaerobacillus isosaccharinicus]MBA5587557.1 ABC transporter ATP-binding protein [Anaerobacillus isosaccharinicus]QOY34266.1 ABC transporter ATP-binding protein [Anaerobacillus isosaccharinicus]
MKVEVKDVTKSYRSKTALANLTVAFEEDKIYGLLGRNGAGKTTLMQLLAGYTLPSSGEVLLNGETPFNNRNILKDICLINESENFKKRLKIKDVLKVASLFYPNWSQETAEYLLKQFNLEPNLKTKGLSKGMESSVGIVIGLASRAKITIFDEPYIGLDASARYKFYDILLEEYETYPRTIILSTHLIDEVSNLFEEVVILQNGKLLLQKDKDELVQLSLQVSGKSEVVDQFTKGKNVIHEAEIVGMKTVQLFGENYSSEEAISLGLQVERCNVQQLMVYLTEERGGK